VVVASLPSASISRRSAGCWLAGLVLVPCRYQSRVHDVLRVQRRLMLRISATAPTPGLVDQVADLVQADAVLAGAGAAQRMRALHHLHVQALGGGSRSVGSFGSSR
jgi:hypothetical protein